MRAFLLLIYSYFFFPYHRYFTTTTPCPLRSEACVGWRREVLGNSLIGIMFDLRNPTRDISIT